MPVLYADLPRRRTVQFVADALALTWVAGAVWLGRQVEQTLAGPAEALRRSTTSLGDMGEDVARSAKSVGDLPLIGDRLSGPVGQVADAAEQVSSTAGSISGALLDVARLAGLTTTVVLVVVALLVWLPPRLHFVVGATRLRRAMRQPGALDLLALRALSNAPLPHLQRVAGDPVAAWAQRDPVVVRRLADLALRPYGLTWPHSALIEGTAEEASASGSTTALPMPSSAPLGRIDSGGGSR